MDNAIYRIQIDDTNTSLELFSTIDMLPINTHIYLHIPYKHTFTTDEIVLKKLINTVRKGHHITIISTQKSFRDICLEHNIDAISIIPIPLSTHRIDTLTDIHTLINSEDKALFSTREIAKTDDEDEVDILTHEAMSANYDTIDDDKHPIISNIKDEIDAFEDDVFTLQEPQFDNEYYKNKEKEQYDSDDNNLVVPYNQLSLDGIFDVFRDENGIIPWRSKLFFILLAAILGLISLLMFMSPSATITIKPRVNPVPETRNVIITLPESTLPKEVEYLPKIDGEVVMTEIKGVETFPTTDVRYEMTNARGIITLYNKTNESKTLIPSRLKSDTNEIFRFKERVVIPPRSNGIDGSTTVEIVADEYDENKEPIGKRGNLSAGTVLYLPALGDTGKEQVYAKVDQGPLIGGSTLPIYTLTDKDFSGAEPLIKELFKSRGIEKMKEIAASKSSKENKKYTLLSNNKLIKADISNITYPQNDVGKEQKTFDVEATVQVFGVIIDEEKILQVLKDKLKDTQDVRKKLLRIDENSLQYAVLDADNAANDKWIKLSVTLTGLEVADINAENREAVEYKKQLLEDIAGMPKEVAKGILENAESVDDVVSIRLSPPWIDRLPKLLSQIDIVQDDDNL